MQTKFCYGFKNIFEKKEENDDSIYCQEDFLHNTGSHLDSNNGLDSHFRFGMKHLKFKGMILFKIEVLAFKDEITPITDKLIPNFTDIFKVKLLNYPLKHSLYIENKQFLLDELDFDMNIDSVFAFVHLIQFD